jgi:PPOX class probable F420-dependent enzyme
VEARPDGRDDGRDAEAESTRLMELARALDFVREHRDAVMQTYRRDGSPQLSPITCAVDRGGVIVVSTRETALKTANLRRDPRVSLCVLSEGFYGDWIQVDGRAAVVSLPDALEPLVEYYRTLRGEHPDWDEYRDAMVRDRRCLVRITPERAGPDRAG